MKVVVAGSSGLIGTALVRALRADQHDVVRLVRRSPGAPDEFRWDPPSGHLDPHALRGADAVVNLCGAGLADKRWSDSYKRVLRDSRVAPTALLAAAVAKAGVPLLVNASGVNYYGPGEAPVTEADGPGEGFLAGLCVEWEAATAAAAAAGARTVLLRSGAVLTGAGGMLARLTSLYSLGLGARLGSGKQYVPWVSLADALGVISFALARPDLRGPVNVVGPELVTNADFHHAVAHALHRPGFLIAPSFAIRLALGEFADEAVLTGPRAEPAALRAAGYPFQQQTLSAALDAALTPE